MVDLKCRPVFIDVDRRSIPPQCQVHGTMRVDCLRGDQTWSKLTPINSKQSPVSLASDLSPSFTQLWFPVTPARRLQQLERMKGTNVSPLAFARPLNAYTAIANRKLAVQPLEQRPVTEVFIEKLPSDNDNDDDDGADGDNDIDEDNADEDDDDGNVHADLDDDK